MTSGMPGTSEVGGVPCQPHAQCMHGDMAIQKIHVISKIPFEGPHWILRWKLKRSAEQVKHFLQRSQNTH
jgi:hypothetical protein